MTPLSEHRALPVLIGGFAFLFLVLLISGIVAIDSMRFIESDAARFAAEQQATLRLIVEVQSDEGNLSSVFYSLVAGQGYVNGEPLLKRLDALETAIHRTTDIGSDSGDAMLWTNVRNAADAFIEEGRQTVRSRRPPSNQFYLRHQNLLAALANLTGSNLASGAALRMERERLSSRIQYSFVLLGAALAVAVGGALLTVYIVNRMFGRLGWQAAELADLSSRTMSDQEETAQRLSREMHDHFGQTLSAIEANLVSMQNARAFHPGRIEDCLGLVKDAVQNVREVSQLLRPTILDDFGLNASLRWLADSFSERTGKTVRYSGSFNGRLDGAIETQLFRIAQEALTNVSRHANATQVEIDLSGGSHELTLSITDNGKGMDMQAIGRGSGLVGMRARARSAGAILTVNSRPGEGVSVRVQVPLHNSAYVAQDSHTVSR